MKCRVLDVRSTTTLIQSLNLRIVYELITLSSVLYIL
jgi:hypothetical protein